MEAEECMNRTRFLAAFAALFPCFSQGAVVVVATNYRTGTAGNGLTNPIVFNGALAPAGAGTVAVGIFGATDADIRAVGGNPAAWAAVAATFQQFGTSARIGDGAGASPGQPGLFQITPEANVTGTNFSGKNVYVAIGSGATLAASSLFVVFKSDTTFADEPTPSVSAFLADVATGQLPAGMFLLGRLTAPQVYYTTGPLANQALTGITDCGLNASELCPIPEPTAGLLAVLGLGFGFARRRR
jgi:hypothetical protein